MRTTTILRYAAIVAVAFGIARAQHTESSGVPDANPTGKPRPEIRFDPATRIVTIKTAVQDNDGYFIPNIRRDNFAVYENGIRQPDPKVEIEHAPVSLEVLAEWGGRYQALNRTLGEEVPR